MSSRCERCRCERFCSNLGRRGSRPPTRPRGVRQERFDPQAFRSGLTTEPGPVDCRLLPRRVPNRVPNFPVLAGLGRTDRTVTWTEPLVLGLCGLPRTESGGLLIRRFWVQVPGGAPQQAADQVKHWSGRLRVTNGCRVGYQRSLLDRLLDSVWRASNTRNRATRAAPPRGPAVRPLALDNHDRAPNRA
jgi:hypothetical protein